MALAGDFANPPPASIEDMPKDAVTEPNTANETPSVLGTSDTSQGVVDAEHRIAALERERDALAAEVDRLGRHQETSPEEVASLPQLPAVIASPVAATSREVSAHSETAASGLELRAAFLAPGIPARVLIRYPRNNADVRRWAQSLADALPKEGLEVADLRESDGAVRTDLIFFYVRDAASAQRIALSLASRQRVAYNRRTALWLVRAQLSSVFPALATYR